MVLNYFENFLVFISTASGCTSVSTFASLVGVLVVAASFAAGLKFCATTAGIKKYKSIIQKNRKRHEEKLDTIEVLIFKSLISWNIFHDKFISVNNVLQKQNEMKEEMKNPQNAVEYIIQQWWNCIVSVVRKILQTKIQVSF